MEKKSYISAYQAVMLLFVGRIMFSSSYQAAIQAENSFQDLLISVVITFILNFIVAIPILSLLKRYPQNDIIEGGINISGRGFGSFLAILYSLFFIFNATVIAGNFENFFTATIVPEVKAYFSGLLLIIVCLYGAVKGIESIARFGSVVAVIYILTFILIVSCLIQRIDWNELRPLLYNGPGIMLRGVIMNYNMSIQIVALGILMSNIVPGKSPFKTFAAWNILSTVIFFILELMIITVTGAYGASDIYPVRLLASIAQISVFERLDIFDMIAWVMNIILTLTLYIYLAVACLLKIGLNKHRRLLIFVSGVIVLLGSLYFSSDFPILQSIMVSGYYSLINTIFIVIIPLVLLIIDTVKGKVLQNANKNA